MFLSAGLYSKLLSDDQRLLEAVLLSMITIQTMRCHLQNVPLDESPSPQNFMWNSVFFWRMPFQEEKFILETRDSKSSKGSAPVTKTVDMVSSWRLRSEVSSSRPTVKMTRETGWRHWMMSFVVRVSYRSEWQTDSLTHSLILAQFYFHVLCLALCWQPYCDLVWLLLLVSLSIIFNKLINFPWNIYVTHNDCNINGLTNIRVTVWMLVTRSVGVYIIIHDCLDFVTN